MASGQQNDYQEDASKSTKQIFSDNILTLFNFLNFGIGICLLFVGAYSNMAYLALLSSISLLEFIKKYMQEILYGNYRLFPIRSTSDPGR